MSYPLFLFTGPSGVGKDTIIRGIREKFPVAAIAVSHTTRPMRSGEIEGDNYYYISEEEFYNMDREGEFLESVFYSGNRYAISFSEISSIQERGQVPMLIVEANGAQDIRDVYREPYYDIYLEPPGNTLDGKIAALASRMFKRGDSVANIVKRLKLVSEELPRSVDFKYKVVADTLENSVSRCIQIIIANMGDVNV